MRKIVAYFLVLGCLGTLGLRAERIESMRAPGDYAPFPEPDSGYVTDHAELLTPEEEEGIEQLLWSVEKKSGVEIVVVTIPSMRAYAGVKVRSIEEFAQRLFDAYGIGTMPKNDGVLLLVSSGDREARIELGAYYGRTKDKDAQQIMDQKIVPAFKKGKFGKGITNGVHAIVSEFTGRWVVGLDDIKIWGAGALALGVIAFSLFKNGKRGWGWIVLGLLLVVIVILIKITFAVLTAIAESSENGHSSGWSSGGFGGGFGGGFSGGGGASGSW